MWSADVDKTRDRCKKLLEYYKREGLWRMFEFSNKM